VKQGYLFVLLDERSLLELKLVGGLRSFNFEE
jgi:hypothetical protein